MTILDRILVSVDWESKFPLAKVKVLPKGCSDHNPLKVDFGENNTVREQVFRFKKWWMEVDGFEDLVKKA
jgi:hypothetical protein